jgi:uncharacterized membrane protein YdbT with pleckstrin-like domain
VINNQRLIIKRGFVQRTTWENLLQKIENIQVIQSIPGRLLNYGTILVHGTGGTKEVFASINDPLTFRKHAQEQIEKLLIT